MKKWVKILLSVVLILLVVLAAAAWKQRENLKAVSIALTHDRDELIGQMEEREKEKDDVLEEFDITVKAPSLEDNDKLIDGLATPEEIKAQLGIRPPEPLPEDDSPSKQPGQTDSPKKPEKPGQTKDPGQNKKKIDHLVDACISELYSCEVDLMAHLGAMKQDCIHTWEQLPAAQQTRDKLIELGMDGLNQCYDLEVVIDGQVKGILERYWKQLEPLGAKEQPLRELWSYYCDKKASSKAYYIDKYTDKYLN